MRNPTPAADSQPAMTPATATVPATGPATPPPRAARHGHWQRENPRLPDRERYRRSTPRPRPRKGHRPAPMHRRAATQPLHNRAAIARHAANRGEPAHALDSRIDRKSVV